MVNVEEFGGEKGGGRLGTNRKSRERFNMNAIARLNGQGGGQLRRKSTEVNRVTSCLQNVVGHAFTPPVIQT
jgi:hypothetical protein